MKSPILGGASVAGSVNAADNRMVNLFPEMVHDGGKEPAWLSRAPGLKLLATLGNGPIRGMWTTNDDAYVVSGVEVYKVTPALTATLVGTVSGEGPVSMADNGTQVFIACNGPSYIYNVFTGVFARITDIDFPGALMVGYLDGYFAFIPPDSQQIWVTSLLDGTTVDPLDFASAEGSPDGVVALVIDHREAWLFGTNTVEVWYNSGNADFPLQRIQGAFNEVGCVAPFSVAKLDNGLFWLGADARGQGIVYRSQGYAGKRISTHTVEWQIQKYGNMSDALAYTYQQDGHSFYVLIFPSANTTWVYDVATDVWHERAGFFDGEFVRHRSNCQMSFAGEIIVGDYENGNLYTFDLERYSDHLSAQKWLRTWRALPTGNNNLTRTQQYSLQIDAEAGVGLPGVAAMEDTWLWTEGGSDIVTETGDNRLLLAVDELANAIQPQVMLRWSDDGGHTWSNEHWRGLGAIGETGSRIIWRRLGMTMKLRDRVYELSGTDPVKIAIMGAELNLAPTTA